MKKLPIAAIQLCSGQDRDENLARARALMEEAVKCGARLIALPEDLPVLGHDRDKLGLAEDLKTGPTVGFLRSFAAQHGVAACQWKRPAAPRRVDPGQLGGECRCVLGPRPPSFRYRLSKGSATNFRTSLLRSGSLLDSQRQEVPS